MTRNSLMSLLVVALLGSGCEAAATPPGATAEFVTATLPPTAAAPATRTPAPPTTAPDVAPIPGMTTSEVNVRADTSTASPLLGTIPAFSTVQIIGKDASGLWLQVVFNGGTGWARADFVQAEESAAEIPVVGAESGAGSGARGVVLRGVNVRAGPGQDFDALGLLNQNDVVAIYARDSSGAWMKVAFPPAPDGTGWVAAEFLQADNVAAIPLYEESAPLEAPATAVDAPDENDSASAPLAAFALSASAARAVVFRGEVSAPDGEDWIGVSSAYAGIVIEFSCNAGAAQAELRREDGAQVALIACGGATAAAVEPNRPHLLKVSMGDSGSSQYEIRISVAGQ